MSEEFEFISNPSDDESGPESVTFSDLSQDDDFTEDHFEDDSVSSEFLPPTPPDDKDVSQEILESPSLSTISLCNSNSTLKMPSVATKKGGVASSVIGDPVGDNDPMDVSEFPTKYVAPTFTGYESWGKFEGAVKLVAFGSYRPSVMRLLYTVGELIPVDVRYFYADSKDQVEELTMTSTADMIPARKPVQNFADIAEHGKTLVVCHYSAQDDWIRVKHETGPYTFIPLLVTVAEDYKGQVTVKRGSPVMKDNAEYPMTLKDLSCVTSGEIASMLASRDIGMLAPKTLRPARQFTAIAWTCFAMLCMALILSFKWPNHQLVPAATVDRQVATRFTNALITPEPKGLVELHVTVHNEGDEQVFFYSGNVSHEHEVGNEVVNKWADYAVEAWHGMDSLTQVLYHLSDFIKREVHLAFDRVLDSEVWKVVADAKKNPRKYYDAAHGATKLRLEQLQEWMRTDAKKFGIGVMEQSKESLKYAGEQMEAAWVRLHFHKRPSNFDQQRAQALEYGKRIWKLASSRAVRLTH